MTRTLARSVIVAVVVAGAWLGFDRFRQTRPGPVVNPQYLEFRPSQDHDAVDKGGAPIVERYVLEVYLGGASVPAQKIDLRKPAPAADGLIHVDLSSVPIATLQPGATYEAVIVAVGPHGEGDSARSNRFTFSPR
jgi:hypothetical protein